MTKTQRNDLVRSLSCCECGYPPRSQLAHSNNYKHGKGMGIKADDYYTIPLCDTCHKDFDQKRRGEEFDYDGWFIKKHAETNARIRWATRQQEQDGVDF